MVDDLRMLLRLLAHVQEGVGKSVVAAEVDAVLQRRGCKLQSPGSKARVGKSLTFSRQRKPSCFYLDVG